MTFAVREQFLNFSNDSMLFLINFRDFKKRVTDGLTDGPTHQLTDGPTNGWMDRPSYRDAWTHLKSMSKALLKKGVLVKTRPSP